MGDMTTTLSIHKLRIPPTAPPELRTEQSAGRDSDHDFRWAHARGGTGGCGRGVRAQGKNVRGEHLFVRSGVSRPSRLGTCVTAFFSSPVSTTARRLRTRHAVGELLPDQVLQCLPLIGVDPCGVPFLLGQMCFQLPLDLPHVKWRLSGRCRRAKSQVSFEILTARLL